MNQKETITLELPKNIVEFLRACFVDSKKYLEETIIEGIKADIDNQIIIAESVAEKYKLV